MDRLRPSTLFVLLLHVCVTLCPEGASASPATDPFVFSGPAEPPPSLEFTFPCDRIDGCRNPGSSQQPDRQIRPFEGTLGRPCGYRERPTPSGPRRVRVCY